MKQSNSKTRSAHCSQTWLMSFQHFLSADHAFVWLCLDNSWVSHKMQRRSGWWWDCKWRLMSLCVVGALVWNCPLVTVSCMRLPSAITSIKDQQCSSQIYCPGPSVVHVSCLPQLHIWGNILLNSVGQIAHELLTKACNNILDGKICFLSFPLQDRRPWYNSILNSYHFEHWGILSSMGPQVVSSNAQLQQTLYFVGRLPE